MNEKMTALELRSCFGLSLIFLLRMFGLFLILPVFVLYAEKLPDATPLLAGIALGSYGLTQALLQIPFGALSDRIGRKKIIIGGLLIFTVGSLVAASSHSIYLIILGRALQGAGAIASAIMALASDLTRENQRSKAMAIIGVSIGVSFMLAFVAGPILNPYIGVPGLFVVSAVLAILGIVVLVIIVPNPPQTVSHDHSAPMWHDIKDVLHSSQLFRFFAGVFILHMMLMASFVALPLVLRDNANIPSAEHWHVYLPVMFISGVLMVPFLIGAEKYKKHNLFLSCAIILMIISQSCLTFWHQTIYQIGLVLILFFLSFNFLEASLPAMISKAVPPARKGAAMGVYSTSQFIGTFFGGLFGGFLHQRIGLNSIFIFCVCVGVIWLMLDISIQKILQDSSL